MTTAVVDNKSRIRIPSLKPGQVLAYSENDDGTVTLCPVIAAPKERPYDPHLYADYPQERIDLEEASSKVDVSNEERDRK